MSPLEMFVLLFTICELVSYISGTNVNIVSFFRVSNGKNKKLIQGDVLDTLHVMTVLDCARQCSRRSGCRGYRFHDTNGTCLKLSEVKMTDSHFATYTKIVPIFVSPQKDAKKPDDPPELASSSHQLHESESLSCLQPQLITESTSSANDTDQILHHACEVGKLCLVQYILSKGLSDINCRGKLGRTPIMVAARMGQTKVFDFLVNQNCDLSAVDENKDNVLHISCIGGNTDIVRKLIVNEQYNIECKGKFGWTPVMYAAYHGNRDIFDLLEGKGCNLKAVDDKRNNILIVACYGGHLDMVKHIITMKGFGLEDRGQYGRTPLMAASRSGHVQVVKFLVTKGSNIGSVDYRKYNFLLVACMGEHVEMVKYILSMKVVGIEDRGQYGMTPVMVASASGHVGVVKFLVSKGCNLSATDDDKDNILHVACFGGHVEMVKYILSMKVVGIEERGQYGMTPVMVASASGHVGVVKFLVSKGCNLRATGDVKDNILHVACFGGHVEMVKYVLSMKVVSIEDRGKNRRTPVIAAAGSGHVQVVKLLVSKGCNLRAVDAGKNNILHVACIGGHVDMVKYILSMKAVSIEDRGKYGRTPVMAAIGNNHVGVVKFLVSKGCNLRATDDYQDNILHVACLGGIVDMVKYIISVNIVGLEDRGNVGRTPVMAAVVSGHVEVVKYLVSKGCNLRGTANDKMNNLFSACLIGHVDLVRYILSMKIFGIESQGPYGRTPVMAAAGNGHVGVVKFLVSRDCNIKALDVERNNILHVACAGGHVNMVKYLIKLHVSRTHKNKYGTTPDNIGICKGNAFTLFKRGM